MNPWLQILKNLPLSRTELEVVRRFESDPTGRTFLPIADILRSHKRLEESLELLTQGVERHPSFTVARVVLARELYAKGLVFEAWRRLEESPVSLRDNVLAQKLKLKMAVLLGRANDALTTLEHMRIYRMLDGELLRMGEMLFAGSGGLAQAADLVRGEFRARGVEPLLLSEPEPEPNLPEGGARAALSTMAGLSTPVGESSGAQAMERAGAYLEASSEPEVAGFHVVALDEIFKPHDASSDAGDRFTLGAGLELDSTTLADIYAKQGHYGKALGVYRRLLRMTPHNDFLRKKVAELAKLEREQRDVDLTEDPALFDRMESLEIIERQMRFYNQLLSRLG